MYAYYVWVWWCITGIAEYVWNAVLTKSHEEVVKKRAPLIYGC